MNNTAEKRIVMIIATLGAFLTPFMGSSIVVALPSIGKDLHANTFVLNWIVSSFLLASAIFVIPFGRAADILGRKRVYLAGMIIYTVSSTLCAFSYTTESLILFRILQGIGAAMIFGTGVAMLTSVYEAGERGKALGVNVAVTYLGLSAGPVLGGILTQYFGWRSIFILNIPAGAAIIALLSFNLKHDWAEAKEERFDFIGSFIYGIGLFGVILGLSLIEEEWWAPLLLAAGVAALIVFAFYESKVEHPVLNTALFKNNRILMFSSLAALINYSATYAVSFLVSLYLQYVHALSPREAGLILIAQPGMQALLSPVAGKLSDRTEPQKVASMGMAMTALGLFSLIFLDESTKMFFIVAALIFLGFGLALFSSPNTNAIMSSVDRKFYGVTSGIMGTARLVGQTFSMGVVSLIFALNIGGAHLSADYHPNFISSIRILFITFTILCVLGIFASLARGKLRD